MSNTGALKHIYLVVSLAGKTHSPHRISLSDRTCEATTSISRHTACITPVPTDAALLTFEFTSLGAFEWHQSVTVSSDSPDHTLLKKATTTTKKGLALAAACQTSFDTIARTTAGTSMGDSKLAAPALLVVAILIGMRLFSLASPPLPPPRCSFVTTASTTVSTTASTSMGDSKPATALLVVVILIGTSPPPPMSPPRACVAFPRPCRLPPPLLPPPALATSPRPRHLPPPVLPPPALVASPHPCRLPPSRFS
ncbi:unnamed protein product [Closterium sp. NIES-53]